LSESRRISVSFSPYVRWRTSSMPHSNRWRCWDAFRRERCFRLRQRGERRRLLASLVRHDTSWKRSRSAAASAMKHCGNWRSFPAAPNLFRSAVTSRRRGYCNSAMQPCGGKWAGYEGKIENQILERDQTMPRMESIACDSMRRKAIGGYEWICADEGVFGRKPADVGTKISGVVSIRQINRFQETPLRSDLIKLCLLAFSNAQSGSGGRAFQQDLRGLEALRKGCKPTSPRSCARRATARAYEEPSEQHRRFMLAHVHSQAACGIIGRFASKRRRPWIRSSSGPIKGRPGIPSLIVL